MRAHLTPSILATRDRTGGRIHLNPAVVSASGGSAPALPTAAELNPLFGSPSGPKMAVSNNPEILWGEGVLYTNAARNPGLRAAPTELAEVMLYFHHINQRLPLGLEAPGSVLGDVFLPVNVSVLLTNPTKLPIQVDVSGAAFAQNDVDGLALGKSPDFLVTKAWASGNLRSLALRIDPGKSALVTTLAVSGNREVDGLFKIKGSGNFNIYVVAHAKPGIDEAVKQMKTDARGDIRSPGPGKFGRTAGVYSNSTWSGRADLSIAAVGKRYSFAVNSAPNQGSPPFAGVAVLGDSAQAAVGMYGAVYDLDLCLTNESPAERKVRVSFASIGAGNPSRFWDGIGLVDGQPATIQHTPQKRSTVLKTLTLSPQSDMPFRFKAQVPGLASIPQAFSIETIA